MAGIDVAKQLTPIMQDHNLQQIDDRYAYLNAEDHFTQAGSPPIDRDWLTAENNLDRQAAQANIGKGAETA